MTDEKRNRIAEGIAAAFHPGAARAARIHEAEDRVLAAASALGQDGPAALEKARHLFVSSARLPDTYSYLDALDEVYAEMAAASSVKEGGAPGETGVAE